MHPSAFSVVNLIRRIFAAKRNLSSGLLWGVALGGVSLGCFGAESLANPLSLKKAVELAHQQDPWIAGSRHKQKSLQALSKGVTALPNPKLSLALVNLPSASMSLHQEPMTQVKVGISQMLPRGDSLNIRQQQLLSMSEQQPWHRLDRKHQVELQVTRLWLKAYQAFHSINLIEQDRALFEHLADVAQSNYSSGLGKTLQQDVVRAQLELTRLEDRLMLLQEQWETQQMSLSQWLIRDASIASNGAIKLDTNAPKIRLKHASILMPNWNDSNWLEMLQAHPSVKVLELKVQVGQQEIALANQNYQPQWSLNASYSYRADDSFGHERSDLFSVGVGLEMPLFSTRNEDSKVRSAKERAEALKTDKALLLRELLAGAKSSTSRLKSLNQRKTLFERSLLGAMSEQVDASLNAYTNDEGDFAEVVRAKIAELNARIEVFDIDIQRLLTIAQINYYLAGMSGSRLEVTHD